MHFLGMYLLIHTGKNLIHDRKKSLVNKNE